MEKIDLRVRELFLAWTKRKIWLHQSPREVNFSEREVWWVSLGQNIGSEENGKYGRFERPVIVLKKASQNLFLAIPLSTIVKTGSWYFTFEFHGEPRSALLVQCRTISSRRLIRKMGSVDPQTFQKIQTAYVEYIKNESPGFSGGFSGPLARQCEENIPVNDAAVND